MIFSAYSSMAKRLGAKQIMREGNELCAVFADMVVWLDFENGKASADSGRITDDEVDLPNEGAEELVTIFLENMEEK